MPLSFRSLVQTASKSLENRDTRRREAADRQSANELAVLQRSLLQAQINKLNAPPVAPEETFGQPTELRGGDFAQIGSRGTVRRLGVQAPERRDPNAPSTVVRQPQVTEREKASFGSLALQANETVNRLEAQDPSLGARVATKAARYTGVIGGLGRRLLGASPEQIANAAEAEIERSMSPDELAYYQASKAYLSNVLPALSGKAVTAREWLMQAPAYFPLGATAPDVSQTRQTARAQRVRGFFREAGPAAEEVLEELRQMGIDLSPYGYGAPVPQPTTPPPPNTPGYNPRFWRPNGRP